MTESQCSNLMARLKDVQGIIIFKRIGKMSWRSFAFDGVYMYEYKWVNCLVGSEWVYAFKPPSSSQYAIVHRSGVLPKEWAGY